LHQITCAVAADTDQQKLQHIALLKGACHNLHGTVSDSECANECTVHQQERGTVVLRKESLPAASTMLLSEISREIRKMTLDPETDDQRDDTEDSITIGNGEPQYDHGESQVLQQDGDENRPTGPTLTEAQQSVVSNILDHLDTQRLLFLHSGGGTGKSFVVREINRRLKLLKLSQANTCPTGVGATHLPSGRTFHSVFKTHRPQLNASNEICEMKQALGGNGLKVVVIDEVSMLQCELLVLLDRRLKAMYQHDVMFGGVSILLLGDFVQMPPVKGRSLYSVMYGATKSDQTCARALFAEFTVIELLAQMRAAGCIHQQRLLQQFRALPDFRPTGNQWTEGDKRKYQPMTKDIVDALTTELARKGVMEDEGWTTRSTVVTTSNLDRGVINASMALIYGVKNNQLVIRWRRKLQAEIPIYLQSLIYANGKYPDLHGYFVYGAPGQVLDNGNGNVCFGVANGTPCRMISLGWDDQSIQAKVIQTINACNDQVVDIQVPPDYIIVEVELADADKWPRHLNLSADPSKIHIPIGIKSSNGRKADKDYIMLPDNVKVVYHAHAVDLSFATTTWKSQGGIAMRHVRDFNAEDVTLL
jgi:hypothetical protein